MIDYRSWEKYHAPQKGFSQTTSTLKILLFSFPLYYGLVSGSSTITPKLALLWESQSKAKPELKPMEATGAKNNRDSQQNGVGAF